LTVEGVTIPAGERNKTRETKAWLEDRLLEFGAGQDTAMLAVGGGMTGDLTGFVASTWHRGIPVIQVPTSLLAMVDAALGGKTAVNLPSGKNLVGTLHQPRAVYADTDTLATLADDDYTDGLAEVVKSAVIADARLERSIRELAARDDAALEHLIPRCMQIKSRVVRRDEREAGRRAILNFGHTVAHAVEFVSGYRVRHGPAVAIGMCVEARLATEVTGFPVRQVGRLRKLLAALGLPIDIPHGLDTDDLVEATRRDKKARAGEARYALPQRIGRMLPGQDVTIAIEEARLREVIVSVEPSIDVST
jgi:3-dehydroquinate synthase